MYFYRREMETMEPSFFLSLSIFFLFPFFFFAVMWNIFPHVLFFFFLILDRFKNLLISNSVKHSFFFYSKGFFWNFQISKNSIGENLHKRVERSKRSWLRFFRERSKEGIIGSVEGLIRKKGRASAPPFWIGEILFPSPRFF